MVFQLKEYRKYKNESDSLRYFGENQEINIKVFEKSDLPEDTLKNIAVAFVIRNFYSTKVPLLQIKYDLDSIVEIRDLFKERKALELQKKLSSKK